MSQPEYTIIEGHHRVAAACKRGLGDHEVICYFHPDVESAPLSEKAVAKRVKLSELLADAHNRRLRQWFVDDIAKNFDFGKWTPPVIRNGKGARDSRIGQMYIGVNSTVTSTPAEKFLYRFRAEDPTAIAVAAIIDACGFEGVTAEPTDGYIHAPTACEWVYTGGMFRRKSRETPTALTTALQATKHAYGKTRHAVRPELIRGFGSFAHRYPDIAAEEIARKVRVRYEQPTDLIAQAKVMKEAMGCSLHKAMALVIRQAFNYQRKRPLEEW